jgi:branched-chain amino acid transport system ATP-binding protein
VRRRAGTGSRNAGGADEPLLRVRDLSVRYGGVAAVSAVSFDIREGDVVGLIGPNGAGKTTCIDALSGFTPMSPTTGTGPRLTFRGVVLDDLGPHERARQGFVRTFQSLELFDDLTVRENLLVSASRPSVWSTLTDALFPKRQRDPDVDETLELLGIEQDADRRPSELPNGRRQLVALGRALAASPSLVLLDEPAAGLGPGETEELAALLRQLPGRGVSVLLVDHDMGLVLGVCDQVHVLDFGSIIASGPPEQIRNDPVVVSAYLGRSATPPGGDPATQGAGPQKETA